VIESTVSTGFKREGKEHAHRGRSVVTRPSPQALPKGRERRRGRAAQPEYVNVRQRPDEGFRRYFLNDYFKLWVWYESNKETFIGFQLLWGGDNNENAITWKTTGEFSHHGVADEGLPGAAKMTQILEGDAGRIRPSTIYIFARYAARIDREIVDLVVTRIMEKTGITQAMMENVAKEYRERKSQGEGRAD